jgi:plasmid maintenance system antidote protein VapI
MTIFTPGPNYLIDMLLDKYRLKNDAALSRALKVSPAVISKVRNLRMVVGPTVILRIHEVFGTPVADLRAWGGLVDPRA